MLLRVTINGWFAVWLCFCVDAFAARLVCLLQAGQQVVFHHNVPAHIFGQDCTDLPSVMTAADSQMTTSFFMLGPVTGWKKNHSQMTTGIWVF